MTDEQADDDQTLVQSSHKGNIFKKVSSLSKLDSTLLTYGEGKGINTLANCAAPLLILLAELKQAHNCSDINQLSDRLHTEVKRFTQKARALKIPLIQINLSSYLICASLDEFILKILGQRANLWTPHALLSSFHQDGGAGEKFFAIIEQLLQDARANQSVLEIAILCVNFGFEGKYQVMDNGGAQRQLFKDKLANHLLKLHEENAGLLQTDVKPLFGRRGLLLRLSAWHLIGGFLGASLLLYLAFTVLLHYSAKAPFTLLDNIAKMQVQQPNS